MFANEDNSRRFVKALVRMNRTQDLKLLASDSWGAKIHPVYGQEEAAVGTITILVKRKDIRGASGSEKRSENQLVTVYLDSVTVGESVLVMIERVT